MLVRFREVFAVEPSGSTADVTDWEDRHGENRGQYGVEHTVSSMETEDVDTV